MCGNSWDRNIFLRPKGDNRIAQGFSPGNGVIRKIALKVAAEAGLVRTKFNDGMMKNKHEVVSPRTPFQGGFVGDAFPGLKPRLRKAYVAASSKTTEGSQVRARHSVATAAWAVLFSPFGRGMAGDR